MFDAAAIEAAEARLGIRLPPSYRDHVLRHRPEHRRSRPAPRGEEGSPPLLSIEEIDRFEALEPDWLAAFRHGYEAGGGGGGLLADDPEDPATFRLEELGGTVVISGVVDGRVLLLNPARVGSDDEWEAWDFANWYPGAYRYPSFAALLRRVADE
jgi:hypothetical protein